MKNVLLTLVSCSALSACTAYPPTRPPASAYTRPVRPPGWTTGVNSVEELRRYSARPTPTPPGWTPPPNAPYAAPPVPSVYNAAVADRELNRRLSEDPRARALLAQAEAEEQAEALRKARQQQIDALNGIREEVGETNQAIRDLPMRQYIWGD